MEKCKFTSTFSTSRKIRCIATGNTECITDLLINQNLRFPGITNNNRHLSGNQMPSYVVGNEIGCDSMKISRGTSKSGDVKGGEGLESMPKHMESN